MDRQRTRQARFNVCKIRFVLLAPPSHRGIADGLPFVAKRPYVDVAVGSGRLAECTKRPPLTALIERDGAWGVPSTRRRACDPGRRTGSERRARHQEGRGAVEALLFFGTEPAKPQKP